MKYGPQVGYLGPQIKRTKLKAFGCKLTVFDWGK